MACMLTMRPRAYDAQEALRPAGACTRYPRGQAKGCMAAGEPPCPGQLASFFARSRQGRDCQLTPLPPLPPPLSLQTGIRNPEVEAQLAEAGMKVVADRCLMVDHRQAAAAGMMGGKL